MGIIVRVRPRDSVSYIRSCVVLLSIELITFLYVNTTVIQIIARMGVYGSFILCGVFSLHTCLHVVCKHKASATP